MTTRNGRIMAVSALILVSEFNNAIIMAITRKMLNSSLPATRLPMKIDSKAMVGFPENA
jgi:hypothetical protein